QFILLLQIMKSHIIIVLYTVLACVSGQVNGHQDLISIDANNQWEVHVMDNGHKQPEYYGYEQLCPDAEKIAPCVCQQSWDNTLDLNCWAVESEEQLKQIFKADFPLKNFRKFYLHHNNNIKVLEAGVFNGVSFEIIYIRYNKLEVIESHALDSCYDTATDMDFQNNNMTSFPFDELSHFSKLSNFDISNNLLSMIPADAFNGLTALEYLHLNGNTAKIVGTFQELPNLHGIYLGGNDLTTIPVNFINTGSSKLNYIGLSENHIVSVDPSAFDIGDSLDIDMWQNSLSTLDEATWRPYFEAGGVLEADDNPLMCGCDVAWLFGEDQLRDEIGYETTCINGENLYDLDPKIFDEC
ncbi:unnamed protein product, partial [Meganyctiphanes norvegica]